MFLMTFIIKTSHERYGFSDRRQLDSLTLLLCHYNVVIMGTIAYQITSLTIVYSIVYSDADQRKHQSSALLAFVWGIHRGPVNSPHKWPVTRKMFLCDGVIMQHLVQVNNKNTNSPHPRSFVRGIHRWPICIVRKRQRSVPYNLTGNRPL